MSASDTLDFSRPLTTVDIVIFTVKDDRLHVLLVQRPNDARESFPGQWALPGGFVDTDRDNTLKACALRKLQEKTGINAPYLEQLGSWGGATRDPRGWSATHVYYALLPHEQVRLQRGANTREIGWFPITEQGVDKELAFDHREILGAAIERLRSKAEYTSLPAYLLPEEFTLSELQHAYEVVLDRPVKKSPFRTRILSVDLVEESGNMRTGVSRPAVLYRLKSSGTLTIFPRTFSPRSD
ncbi:MAG: NUDIX hydrolase [Gammaproteobacteria bacterium]|nr:NUDIX hydrolase [Gammaproteobacteria bacterium]